MPNPTTTRRLAANRSALIFPGPTPDFHLDANQITGLTDGNAVATWSDVSGHGRDFTQGAGASQPTYRVDVLNHRPSVRFGALKNMTAANLPSSVTSYTMFMVVLSDTSAIQFAFYWGTVTDGMGLYVSTDRSVQHRNLSSVANCIDAAFVINVGEIWTTRRNVTGPLLEYWKNGVSQSITNSTSAMGALSAAGTLGDFSTLGIQWSRDIFEVIGYASLLSDPQKADIERYLKTKYALA